MAADDHAADPRLVEAWVDGWALSRGVARPERVEGGFHLTVGEPGHLARYVFPALDAVALHRLGWGIDQPGVFLKAFCPPEALIAALDERWRLESFADLMVTALDGDPPVEPDPAYRLSTTLEGAVLVTAATAPDGTLAASGRAALTGPFAVFDKIVTDPAHQRRGLGRAVMTRLGAEAVALGAEEGVLAATVEGRALYEALGWRFEGRLHTAAIPGPDA